MSASAQSSPNISRPRPKSMLNRPVRRSTGSAPAPQELQRTLAAASRKISTNSMPSISTVNKHCPSPKHDGSQSPSTPPTIANGQVLRPGFGSHGCLQPRPASDGQSLPTTPLSPLSPVFSAISAEPLQPQKSGSNVSTPNHTPPPSLTDSGEFGSAAASGDKYAALADLDSEFSDPSKATTTTTTAVNWSGDEQQAQDDPANVTDVAESPSTSAAGVSHNSGARRSGLATVAGGAALNARTAVQSDAGNNNNISHAMPSPTLPRMTSTSPITPSAVEEPPLDPSDRYAALASLSDPSNLQSTAVNWGTAQDTVSSSITPAGAVVSPHTSSPAPGTVLGTQGPVPSPGLPPSTMYGPPGGPVTTYPSAHFTTQQAQPAYCTPPTPPQPQQPSQLHHHHHHTMTYTTTPAPIAHPGLVAAAHAVPPGNSYPRYSNATTFTQAPATGLPAAYAAAMAPGSQEVPAVAPGALWGQTVTPTTLPHHHHPSSSSPASPFVTGSQLSSSHIPLCRS